MKIILIILAICVFGAGSAVASDTGAGEQLARQWCNECHLVDAGQKIASDGAPPFEAIANRPETTSLSLRNWLNDPHPPMPKLNLTRIEIDDLVAYIESLAGK
jgi:mono/diheme cytochrome c family protein